MKILIAGGAGYLGSTLAPALQIKGYDVDVIDLLWFGNHLPKEIKVIQKDLFQLDESQLSEYEQVIFLAGLSNDPMAEFSPELNYIYNCELPTYLAHISKRAGVKRFIHGSSCSVYGFTNNELYDEYSPTLCTYPYGLAKVKAEQSIIKLGDEGFSVISLRQGTLSGHSPRMRMDLFVNTMFKTAITEKKIVVNNPFIWRPLCFINDAVDAFSCSIKSNYSLSGIFNIASQNITIGQAGKILKEELQTLTGTNIRLEINNIYDLRNYRVNINKAKTLLGFEPKYKIQDIIKDLYDHQYYYGNFKEVSFYNFDTFLNLEKKLFNIPALHG